MAEAQPINTPKNHPDDIIEVKNITSVDFEYYWDSIPRTIKAGEIKTITRYLAIQFAKKLMDFIINSKNYKVKNPDGTYRDAYRTSDPTIRGRLAPSILLRVVEWHLPSQPVERAKIQAGEQKIDINYQIPEKAAGPKLEIEIPKADEEELFGQPVPPANEVEEEGSPETTPRAPQPAKSPQSPETPQKPQVEPPKPPERGLEELQAEARSMGIAITGTETSEELDSMIAERAGA